MPAGFMSPPDDSTVLMDLSVAASYGFDMSMFRKGGLLGMLVHFRPDLLECFLHLKAPKFQMKLLFCQSQHAPMTHRYVVQGLEHENRRRNRVNATITDVSGPLVTICVDQSFGNCPKYIQKRPVRFDASKLQNAEEHKDTLSGSAEETCQGPANNRLFLSAFPEMLQRTKA